MRTRPDRPEPGGLSDLAGILDEERRRDRTPTRLGKVAVVAAAAGLAVALGAGVTLTATAATSVARHDAAATGSGGGADSGDEASAPEVVVVPSAEPSATAENATEPPATAPAAPLIPGAVGTTATGAPIFDASTDVSLIPIPAKESPVSLSDPGTWLTQQGIIADCMLEAGFTYTFTPYWLRPADDWGNTGPQHADESAEYKLAFDGPPDRPAGEDYDWRTAGCQGYAVHVTGMDDAN